jgi:dTDP-4-dehydrorhamnose reductase
VNGQRVAILGAAGQLGRQLVSAFDAAGNAVTALGHGVLDLSDSAAPRQLVGLQPELIVNAAAWTDVDGCARDPEKAMEINGLAAGRMAAAAASIHAVFIQISTNEVFDGASEQPYAEDADPNPINPYGESKLAGERAVAAANPEHLVVRTAWIFGPGGRNFASKIVEAARTAKERGTALRVVDDEYGNPTWAPDLAVAIVKAADAGCRGILHLAGEPAATRYQWASAILSTFTDLALDPSSSTQYVRPAPVPARAVLSTERWRAMGFQPMDWRLPTRAYAAQLLATTA